MTSRHVPTRRLKSGVLFSAPDDMAQVPPDELTRRHKKLRFTNIRKMIPGVMKKAVGEEMALDAGGIPDYQKSIAMFAQFVDPSPYDASDLSKSLDLPKHKKESLCLPVLKVSLTATVDGTLAHMTLKQSFHNPSQMTIKEARHTFPLYDGSVVTAFECTIGDERRLRGVVKPKNEARREYKEAIRDQTKAAALLEEHTPEIFETSLGNIPPMTTVEIKIVYIQELKVVMMEGEVSEGIALIIPTSIAPRYGKPQSRGGVPPELPHDKLDIEIMVFNDGHINPDCCIEESGHIVYDHGTKMMESPQQLNGEYSVNEYYYWEHHSEVPVLKKDFVFVIPMQKGHEIQSRAILSPPDDSGLAAMMVSIRPNELFRNAITPQSFTGEILFLLDRSASMGNWVGSDGGSSDGSTFGFTRGAPGSCPRKIDVLREAMQLVLVGLPKTCSFNIISWGSATWAMWEQSRQHSPDNIREAKDYISEIRADMGGTDLLRALQSTVERRRDNGKSTQIVVLTDGELDPEGPMEFVWRTRQELQNKVRFFALGIGDEVPRSLIESIAELGGGFGDAVDTAKNPNWHARLNQLTKSALEPDTWDCGINIGDGFQRRSLIDYQPNGDTAEGQPIPYFQAPSTIAGLHPFRFTSIFFLVNVKKDGALPNEVTITTTTDGAKKRVYKLPIQPVTIQNGTIHQLAAKATLMDLEDLVKRRPSSSRLAEENAQTIGIRYSITSKWTSFLAVPPDEAADAQGSVMEYYKAMMEGVDITELLNGQSEDESEDAPRLLIENYHGGYVGNGMHGELPTMLSEAARVHDRNLGGSRRYKDVDVDTPNEVKDEERPVLPYTSAKLLAKVSDGLSIETGKEPEKERVSEPNGDSGLSDPTTFPKARPRAKIDAAARISFDSVEYSFALGIKPEGADMFHGLLFESSGAEVLNSFGSPVRSRSRSRSGEGSATRDVSCAMDPLDWEKAVKYQNGQGLFELPEEARSILNLHFCLDTRSVLALKLSKILRERGLEQILCIRIIDTMMTIKCYQTHLVLTEDIWDLMMERAQDAMVEAVGQDILEGLERILTDSMMHQHCKTATGQEEENGGATSGATCPVCDVGWNSSRPFFCPFDHKPGAPHAFKEWDEFWTHQQEFGHMVCPREGTSGCYN